MTAINSSLARHMKRYNYNLEIFLSLALCISFSNLAYAAASFQGLGDLTGGVFNSKASDVSADGLVVVGSSSSASGTEAFRWSLGGGMVGLGDLASGSFFSEANAVSADGSVVVGVGRSASGPEAFRWESGGGMSGLGDLSGGAFNSTANGVSADGSIVIGTGSVDSGKQAFRWTSATSMTGLGFPPFLPGGLDPFSEGLGVSADGSVIVGGGNDIAVHNSFAYRWTELTGMVSLGGLPHNAHSGGSIATAVSADGLVIVGASTSDTGGPPGNEAFRWTTGGGMDGLGFIFGSTYGLPNIATAVSADGAVIVGISDTEIPSGQQAFIWTANDGIHLLQTVLTGLGLDLTGWTLESATGISDDGLTITGWGTNPDGNTEAFIATLPEPGTVLVITLGLSALLARRGRGLPHA